MGQCLVDPNTGELDSEHSYLNSKRKVTTGSKWKQIHVKWDDCTGLEHGSKLHVIMDGAPVAKVNCQNSENYNA